MERATILSTIKKHLAYAVEGLEEDDIDPLKSMLSYGASSLDIVSVISSTMRQLKVKLPRAELKNIVVINDLVDLFEKASVQSKL